MQYQLITYWVKHFNGQFRSTNKATHFDIIAFYLGILHGRSRWTWASVQTSLGQTYKERRRKRNNNKLNCVWTTTASQVSWIFAMNSKLNRSSLYYWQQNMLIVLIICAVFHGAISMNNSQTLLLRFKNNIQSAYTPAIAENTETWILCQSMAINEVCDPLSVIIDWSSIGRCQSMLINNN